MAEQNTVSLADLGTIKDDLEGALEAATKIADFVDQYAGKIPLLKSYAGDIDAIDSALHLIQSFLDKV